jgi:Flp pilus assembly protein TadG
MRLNRRDRRCGSSTLEFTLVGIPLMFVLISTFEMARGMWNYHTIAYAVKEGTRYASVHGVNCASSPNTCTVTIGQITQKIVDAGIGLPTNQLRLTFTSQSGATTCYANACLSNATVWPPAPGNVVGSSIQIGATYPFTSAISMFWPGAGTGINFGTVNFPASSRETVQF